VVIAGGYPGAGSRGVTVTEFDPDWTVAPGASLHELMAERHMTVARLAAAMTVATGWPVAEAGKGIRAVLAKETMPEKFPEAAAAVFGMSVQFWANAERIYRADLAKGRKDTTGPLPEPPRRREANHGMA
jgi:plasmid maintenance system antidote protein VapI